MLMMDNSRVLGESALVRVRIHFQRVKGRYVFYWGGGVGRGLEGRVISKIFRKWEGQAFWSRSSRESQRFLNL